MMSENATTTRNDLLAGDFMRRLDALDVRSRKILRGRMQGERRSKQKGQSVEFADYRNYVVGDDLRRIDWNLYARLDKLFLRLFMEEEDLSVSLLVDVTASMNFGEPNKLLYAKRLAAALGYIGLVHYNRVNLYAFTNEIHDQIRGLRGRRPIPRMLEFLQNQPSFSGSGAAARFSTLDAQDASPDASTGSAGDLASVFKRFVMFERQPGVVIVVSDFFEKGNLSAAFRYLAGDRFDVYAIQVLAPQEVEPTVGGVVGDLRLRDIEDGDVAEISVSPTLIKRYKANLQAYCQYVRDQCLRRGIAYMAASTDVPFETVVLKYLRQRGLLG